VDVRFEAWICDCTLAGITDSNLTCIWICCERCVHSSRGICDGPISRPEESYWSWSVWVWSRNLQSPEQLGPSSREKKKYSKRYHCRRGWGKQSNPQNKGNAQNTVTNAL